MRSASSSEDIEVPREQRLELRRDDHCIEISRQYRRSAVVPRVDDRQNIANLARAYALAFRRMVEVRCVDVDRAPAHLEPCVPERAPVVQRLQPVFRPFESRMPRQDRIAEATLVGGRVRRDEPRFVSKLSGKFRRLVAKRFVLQHFLQHDHVGRELLQALDDQWTP
jgi:hypothetical protein